MVDVDPYLLLDLPRGCTYAQLREAFKRASLTSHPDKGGSDEAFNLVTRCFIAVRADIVHAPAEGDVHASLKATHKEQKNQSFDVVDLRESLVGRDGKMSSQKFNQLFEQVRVETAYDVGYGDKMISSSAVREDISIPRGQGKDVNAMFDMAPNKSKRHRNAVVLPVSDGTGSNYELGLVSISDFSGSSGSNLAYTDYSLAHDSLIIDPNATQRKSFKDMDSLQRHRENIGELTQKELRRIQRHAARQEAMDLARAEVEQERERQAVANMRRIKASGR
jgi:hypothetical protein